MNRRQLLLGATATAAAGTGLYLADRGPSYPQAVAPVRAELAARSDADMPYLVHHAVLAANSHNTQPWLFRTGERHLEIAPDRRRETPVVDPDNHHLFASLGCAAENLSLAALAAGANANVAFVSDTAGLRVDLERASSAQEPRTRRYGIASAPEPITMAMPWTPPVSPCSNKPQPYQPAALS